MRAFLRYLPVALTILLVSSTSSAQITGSEPKPGEPTPCQTVSIEPARGWCPGWEVSQNCTQTVFTVVIRNTTTCAIPFFRLAAMPHSQGINFSVCAPGAGLSRPHCGTDPIQVTLDQNPIQPGGIFEMQVMADRQGDLEIFTMCKETFQQCSIPVHVPMFPSPYPSDPNQTPKQPDQPNPYQPTPIPSPAPLGSTIDDNGTLTPMPQDRLPDRRTSRPAGLIENGGGGEVVGGGQ